MRPSPPEQLAQIDKIVNDAILEGYPVVTEVLPIEEAKKKGAIAMFGEKYGDVVRVVEMGGFLHGVLRRHPPGQHRQGRPLPHQVRGLHRLRRPPDRGPPWAS